MAESNSEFRRLKGSALGAASGNDCALVHIIEDSEELRDSLRTLLRSHGFESRAYPTAGAFLTACDGSQRGCLILDLHLPDMNGLELQTELQRRGIDLPIVFLTGHGSVPAAVQAMLAGAVDFLQKPSGEHALVACVRRAIHRDHEAQRAVAEQREFADRIEQLSQREREIADLIVQGATNRQIGERLALAVKTVEYHRPKIMLKLGVRTVAELIRIMLAYGRASGEPPTDA